MPRELQNSQYPFPHPSGTHQPLKQGAAEALPGYVEMMAAHSYVPKSNFVLKEVV